MPSHIDDRRGRRHSGRVRILRGSLFLVLLASWASAQSASFDCSTRLVEVYRYPTALPIDSLPRSVQGANSLLEVEFAAFTPNYGLESVRFVVLFEPDDASSKTINPTGRLRVFARIKNHSKEVWQEITDSGSPSLTASWLHDSTINSLLQTDLANTPEPTDSDGKPYPDPIAGRDGDPQLRIQQAETGVPVLLLKFIGLIPASPYPDVDCGEETPLHCPRA